MVCSLCLKEIKEDEKFLLVENDRIRHVECHNEFESMLGDLEKIADETNPIDI